MYDNYLRLVNKFSIIIYARLSKEETDKSSEEQSRSIKNQIEICQKYIEDERKSYPNCIFEVIAILKDDGISGTTFDRIDFKELINLIEKKRANMVITTDLSRLGRDHIKTDDYIEKWFPEHNVRYVAIVESVDTYTDCMSNDIAPIINWSNEHFAKLTSKKIKGRFALLRSQGKWTGGEPPLGYKLDKKDKYHFIIDENNAFIVKRIFTLFNTGNTLFSIADLLTKEKIPIPTKLKGNKRKLSKDISDLWSTDTIRDILTNEIYLGHMIQGKSTRLNHKSKKIVYLPKDSWIKVENTHEAIIDCESFKKAQLLLKHDKNKTYKSHDYTLKGLLKCAECGHSIGIQYYKNDKNYTICNYYKKYGSKKEVCTAHRFSYENIEKLVLYSLKNDCFKYVNRNLLKQNISKQISSSEKREKLYLSIEKCQKEIKKIEEQLDEIYEDKLNEVITKEYFQKISASKISTLNICNVKLNALEKEFNNLKEKDIDFNVLIGKWIDAEKIDKVLIARLIDKITISEKGEIEIYYNICQPKCDDNCHLHPDAVGPVGPVLPVEPVAPLKP